ncbi:MAG: AsmA family protein [Acidobacteriia bacterium]|nr:AsmA family protein [Terriglobia bacterium]
MKLLRSKRGMAALAAILLLLFLARPGVYGLRNRIANSIGSALGRKVTLDNVRVHLLPRPGFDLEGLVIDDDPAFSAEPMIRAQDVSAAIRFRSLLRGRLEIATLSATEPSINLVRNQEGRWNLASLLERSAHIPVAPTSKSPSELRPAFPYLEAGHARINFKIGQAKKSYALTDADVALWQDSENSWGARMRAQPVRTDFNLTDTGLLEINATWQRASTLRETPVQVAVQWEKGQLGQITKLLSGKDRGWRGGVNLTANLSGTPEALLIKSAIRVDDFHRYDILGSENVHLATACSGRYSVIDGLLDNLLCESPAGTGAFKVAGRLRLSMSQPSYDLTLKVEKVPLASAFGLLRQAKKQLPADLSAAGLLDAEFRAVRDGSAPIEMKGEGTASNVRLFSNAGRNGITFGNIPLSLVGASRPRNRSGKASSDNRGPEPVEPHLRIGTISLVVGGSTPVIASGWVSTSGYRFLVRGDATVRNLFRLANTLGLSGSGPAAEGLAKVDINVSGPWQGFAPPTILGSAQVRNVRAEMRGLNAPIEISSATMTLAPDAVSMEKTSAQIGSTHWSGNVTVPRLCPAPNCVFQFDLAADELSTADLVEWFAPRAAKRPWYRLLNPADPSGISPLLAVQAKGSLRIGHLQLKKVLAGQIATQIGLDRGQIKLTNLRAQLLQGTHQGNWTIDVSTQPPKYEATGTLLNISLAQVGALMNDAWVSGTADARFDGTASGGSFAELLSHASGKFQFLMRNGSLIHLDVSRSTMPFPVHRFTGDLQLEKGNWKLSAGRLESRDGIYQVSGTASSDSGLKFLLTRSDEQSWSVTGTLAKPRLERVNRAESEAKIAAQP